MSTTTLISQRHRNGLSAHLLTAFGSAPTIPVAPSAYGINPMIHTANMVWLVGAEENFCFSGKGDVKRTTTGFLERVLT
jgi:hypothetical protein